MPRYVFVFLFFTLSFSMHGQNLIKGQVLDSLKKPASFSTVGLLQAKDSMVVKGNLTDENGKFQFASIPKGNYLIKATYTGALDTWFGPVEMDSLTQTELPPIILKNSPINLREVGIIAVKDPIEFKNGNITVNIDGSPLAVGNSVYDLLSRLPGVSVDNANISIQGKGGALIYIDDRPQFLAGIQLINLLKGINASIVEKIEVIANPPARYDAAGGAGIINIRMKKVKIVGFSGGANLTYSQGFYENSNGSLSLNYKGKKFTFFSSLNGTQGVRHNIATFDKTITYDNQTTRLNQYTTDDYDNRNIVLDLGTDWYINKKNIVGAKVRSVYGYGFNTVKATTQVSDSSLGYDKLLLEKTLPNDWFMMSYNVNAEHLFDTLGTKLKFSTDYYIPNYDSYKGKYLNSFSTNAVETSAPQDFISNNRLDIHIFTARLDFEKKLTKTLAFDAGLKTSYQDISSDYLLERKNNQTGEYRVDPELTNKFSYFETIAAGYVNFNKEFKKFNFQLGLRGENTGVSTATTDNSVTYKRHYFNLFPNLNASYNLSKNHVFSLTYNKNIDRPNYYILNPYKMFVDVLNYYQGNPFTKQAYIHNFNFNYALKSSIFNSLAYTRYRSPIIDYYAQNDLTKETTQYITNFNYFEVLRYSFFIKQEIKKWWTLSFNFGTYYISYGGKLNGENYSLSAIPHYEWLNNMFVLPKNTKLEVTAYYWSPWLGIASKYKARWGVNLALKKSFLNDNVTCAIALNDIFFTETLTNVSEIQNQQWTRFQSNDTRRLNISLSYNFGKIKAEKRDVESDDKGFRK